MARPLGACCLAALVAASPAYASSADVFGLGSESTALAGAVTACASDFSAVFYNPAGLAFGGAARAVSFGMTGYASKLSVVGRHVDLSDPLGFEVGVRTPAPLGGLLKDRITIGLALHLLPDSILRVVAHTPTEAFFPYYDNRMQRLLLIPGVAVRLSRTLALGIGFNFLAGLSGKVESSQGATRTVEPRIDEKIFSTLKINAGLRWEATPQLSLGLAYRQGFSVPFKTETANAIAGENININIDAEGLFTPDEVWAGAAWSASRLRLSLDAGWLRWSAWRGPFVAVSSDLPIAGQFDVTPPQVPYNDIVSVRAGVVVAAVSREDLALTLRLGGGYEQSPMPDQLGVTNLMDGDKIIGAAGFGLELLRLLPTPVRIDAHVMAHVVADRTYQKQVFKTNDANCPASNMVCGLHDEVRDNNNDPTTLGTQISNPGYPSIAGGGTVWEGGMTVTFAL